MPTANGGTGIAYFTVAGPTVARTYTFPDANSTVLTTASTVAVANGGTGLTSGMSGGLLYFSGTGTIASSAALAANQILLGAGAGSAPTSLSAGTSTTILHGNASGAPTWSAVSLTADVTGTLPVANGGTGVTSLSSITSLSGLTTVGTIGTGTWQASPVGPAYGGTGVVNNAANTLTFTGNFSLGITLTTNTSVTFPSSGTLVNTGVTTLSSLTSAASLATVGTITSGTWSATTIAVNKGGTGLTSLTANNVILGNGTSTPNFVAPGASGNVLTSNGTTWTSAAATSTQILLATVTASSSATVDFTSNINSTYKVYLVELIDVVPVTNSVDLWLRVSEDGSTFVTTGYSWSGDWSSSTGSSNADGTGSDSKFKLNGTSDSISNTGSLNGWVKFYNPAGTSLSKFFLGQVGYSGAAIHDNHTWSGNYNNTTNAIVGIRFLMSTGNISSGTFKLYGLS